MTNTVNEKTFEQGFFFTPLGGSEQFGVNFNLYACDGKWLAFDCGIGFADHRFPNVDILLPDPEFVEGYRDNLLGIVITHAHEDHIGAVPYLWPRLRCPIYCTRFTAAVLRAKFDDFPNCKNAKIIEIDAGTTLSLEKFKLHFLNVSHSIPMAISVGIETPYGTVLHSGDWNNDQTPVIGRPTNPDDFKALGERGVLAYIGDSTNCLSQNHGHSERDVQKGLESLFKEIHGRIAITIFASNVGRIHSIAMAAKAVGRSVCLMGRSLYRMVASAKACGMLHDVAEFLDPEDANSLTSDKVIYIVTGSQGEATAALSRIARGEHPDLKLGQGDTVIFSSRAIPGNEKDISLVKNNLSAGHVTIVDEGSTSHLIHASGHPYRDEVAQMMGWLKPRCVIPVHGEYMMLEAQAELAQSLGISHTILPNNGSVIQLAPGQPAVIDHVSTGLLAVEPQRIVRADHKGLIERRKLQFTGAAHITVALDARGNLLMDPSVTLMGLIDHDDSGELDILEDIKQEIEDLIVDLKAEGITETQRIEEDIRVVVRRLLTQVFGFKPKVSVHLIKV